MIDPASPPPAGPPRLDAAAAEAAAARVMAMHVAQQELDSLHARGDRTASTWLMVGLGAFGGMAAGALMGAVRGHALAGAIMMGLLGALLTVIRQRAY